MTLSDPRDDEACVHETDLYDGWEDVYEVELPVITLHRECPECGEREEYTLSPDTDSDFMRYLTKLKMQRSNGEIADISLQLVETDGVDVFAHLTIERGEGTGVEVVSDEPYYFFY